MGEQFIKIKDERFRLSLISSYEILPANPFTPDTRSLQIKFSGKLIIIPFGNAEEMWKVYNLLQKLLSSFVQVGGTKFIKPTLIKRYKVKEDAVVINSGDYKIKHKPGEFAEYLDKSLGLYEENDNRDEEKIQQVT